MSAVTSCVTNALLFSVIAAFPTLIKGPFIWRIVAPGKRVTLHPEPPRTVEFFIHFFINSSEPFTVHERQCEVGSRGRVTLRGGSLAWKVA